MKKNTKRLGILALLVVLVIGVVALSGCIDEEKTECGYHQGPCCEGDDLISYGKQCPMCGCVCIENICEYCGLDGQFCCDGDECEGRAECGSDGRCHRCGYDDEPCCEGKKCLENHFVCGSDGKCHYCGNNQPCCD